MTVYLEYDILRRAYFLFVIEHLVGGGTYIWKCVDGEIHRIKLDEASRIRHADDAFLCIGKEQAAGFFSGLAEQLAQHKFTPEKPEPVGALQATRAHLADLQKLLFTADIKRKP